MATPQTKTNGHAAAAAAVRLCKCGCKEPVPVGQRFAYIHGHMKRKAAPGKKRGPYKTKNKRRAAQVGHTAAVPATAPSPVRVAELPRVALQVTESQLNDFLVKLPLEDKQWLANRYLREFRL